MSRKPKPTRRQLLAHIAAIQDTIGRAVMVNGDRNPNREFEVRSALEEAHERCIRARASDPPSTEKEVRVALESVVLRRNATM